MTLVGLLGPSSVCWDPRRCVGTLVGMAGGVDITIAAVGPMASYS